ncbi:AtpZ/AtpI family protein [Roseospira visakhapatnamensis]|uniref:ATP synthase protein I n=1 Tax=Roseospira visakhapatnamensis TaxID=390880 RepID=A0A7W6W8Y9_9PROT|nr:AtpZ/AtpI family protein [Roseospira visakhapatnamensis]MBB4265535.1 ATP synthase protein I [Roseospira visakhapatnamensis]
MSDRDRRPDVSDLTARITAAKARHGVPDQPDATDAAGSGPSGIGLGMRISVEMVVTVAVGAGLGYALDVWFGTAPLMMVVLLFLGAAAGVSNVYRVVKGLDDGVGLGRAIDEKRRRDAGSDGPEAERHTE